MADSAGMAVGAAATAETDAACTLWGIGAAFASTKPRRPTRRARSVVYPRFSTLGLAAGEPLVQDVIKCHLSQLRPAAARLRKQQMEGQPVIRVAAGPEPSSVSLSDGTADRQPHPQAVPLGREEGIEQLLEVMRRGSDTRVLHADEDAGAVLSLHALRTR